MSGYFGYSPERAEDMKNELDVLGQRVASRLQRMREVVPSCGAVADRVDALSEQVAEAVTDLQEIVDERTEAAA